jgi:hypothetical protein
MSTVAGRYVEALRGILLHSVLVADRLVDEVEADEGLVTETAG